MVHELLQQIVALSSATVYLLDEARGWRGRGGGGEVLRNDKANDYLSARSARGLESCFSVAGIARVTGG